MAHKLIRRRYYTDRVHQPGGMQSCWSTDWTGDHHRHDNQCQEDQRNANWLIQWPIRPDYSSKHIMSYSRCSMWTWLEFRIFENTKHLGLSGKSAHDREKRFLVVHAVPLPSSLRVPAAVPVEKERERESICLPKTQIRCCHTILDNVGGLPKKAIAHQRWPPIVTISNKWYNIHR